MSVTTKIVRKHIQTNNKLTKKSKKPMQKSTKVNFFKVYYNC